MAPIQRLAIFIAACSLQTIWIEGGSVVDDSNADWCVRRRCQEAIMKIRDRQLMGMLGTQQFTVRYDPVSR
jgi:hypothetical protein